jgi:hypothetical protein
MKKVTLYIESGYDSREISLEDEISIGRSDAARIVLDDVGLSRLNTTFFRDGEDVLVVDENSTNGTFVNGRRLSSAPQLIFDGDEIKLGNDTRIRVAFSESRPSSVVGSPPPVASKPSPKEQKTTDNGQRTTDKKEKLPIVVIGSIASIFLIVFVTIAGYLISNAGSGGSQSNGTRRTPPKINTALAVPIRVVDPMGGGEGDDNLDDLISAWEVQEETIKVENLDKIEAKTTTTADGTVKQSDLNVPIEYFKEQMAKAMKYGKLNNPDPPGLLPLPPELIGGNVSKQKAKLAEMMQRGGYKQPLDFADLATHRMEGSHLVELPSATETYVLDIGGSATEHEFTSFDFDNRYGKLTPDSEDYQTLKKLADNFEGQKYDLNNGRDRRQMRIRMLRMYNKQSRKVLEEIAKAFYDKFKNPLRLSSLSRSMDYQIILNGNNPNSFVVRGKGSLPPHTSGCAIDIPRRTLTADEQNFLMTLFAQMERENKIDALREGASNPCFHFFIYPDGKLAAPDVKFAQMERADEVAELFNLPSAWATFYD